MMYPSKGYPTGVRYAEAPFLVGQLTYSDATKGTLFYIKATLIREMDFTTAGYLASNPEFPHQSTVDQFWAAVCGSAANQRASWDQARRRSLALH